MAARGADADEFEDVAAGLDREVPPFDDTRRYFLHHADPKTVLVFDADRVTPDVIRGLGPRSALTRRSVPYGAFRVRRDDCHA